MPKESYLLSPSMGVKVIRPHLPAKHDVIVEIDKLVGKTGYPVDVRLDGGGRKRGKMTLVGEQLLNNGETQIGLSM